MKRLFFAVALCITAFGVPATVRAQVGSTTDILTGTVVGPNKEPIAGARVEVMSVETQVSRFRTTNDKGQWTLLYPDGGGQYRVTVKAIGMAPYVTNINRQADEDRLEVPTISMSPTSQRLGQIVVRANPNPNGNERPTAGSTEKTMTAEQLYRLPVDASDPALVASLAPGVILLGGSDSTANSFSIAGQRPDQNQITLDGLSFGAGSVPAEAVRSTRVITNTYDVARGQFTGGQVASTTRSGTNILQGSVGFVANQPDLEFPDTSSENTARYISNQLSFGVGGPFSQDQSFWFLSAQANDQINDINTLLNANQLLLERSNASPDSVAHFLNTMGTYGIPTRAVSVPNNALRNRSSALTRMDFALGDQNTLTIRGDWNWSTLDATRLSTLSVPAHGGDTKSLGGGLMASLSSQFDVGIINELRLYASEATNSSDPFLIMPQGTVRVTSALPDSLSGISNLTFGGNAGLPTSTDSRQLELTNEASYFKAGSAHRWKLGFFGNITTFNNNNNTNQLGSWSYNSLTDFDNNTPSEFTRTLTPMVNTGDTENGAIYLGDAWRLSRAFQLTYGVRGEGTRFDGRPAYNPQIDSEFGRRTDNFPSETHISPRFGFTWTSGLPPAPVRDTSAAGLAAAAAAAAANGGGGGGFGGRGGGGGGGRGGRGGGGGGPNLFQGLSTTVIRGGFGEFRGKAPTGLFTNALDANGLPGSESQLVCIGSATPIPDWSNMIDNPNVIPNQCVSGQPNVLASSKPNVTTFAPDFEAPRAWKGSLGIQRRILQRYTVNVDAVYSRGTALYGVTDMNLNTGSPQFALSNEGNRPVYVSPGAIVPTTGALNSLDSRVQPAYGDVYSVNSNLGSETKQVTASINGFTPQGINMSLSYTYQRSRDQISSTGGSVGSLFRSGTTDGDPNVTPWGTSDLERRHNIQATATWPIHPSVELTAVVSYTSGQPYTPLVGGDINGDGSSNDRAYIFNPTTVADTGLANGMSRLLASAPARIKSCLQSQLGQIAGRNSCTSAWYPNVSLQVNYRPDRFGLKRNLMISFALTNPIAGADLLLHGQNNLEGWGQPARINSQLLYVTGFNTTTNNFIYSVNEKFGDQRSNQLIITNPFRVQLTARYTIGPDRQRDALLAAQAAARGRNGNNGAPADTMAQYRRMVQRYVPNIFKTVLDRADTLKLDLTGTQITLLTVLADSLVHQIDTLGIKVAAKMHSIGNNADQAAIQVQLRGILSDAQQMGARAIAETQIILTKEQWAKLPDNVKHPLSVFGPIQGGGGRGGRPPQ
ncbi:MAG TPA: carboxypeptidase regulatory-like domain-containing protein [Gemmatimonadaceae bacterium]